MCEAVRILTPVEYAKGEILGFFEDKELVLNEEMDSKLKEVFDYALKYESEYQSDRFKVADMNVRGYKEENMLLKTQLRVLTKYIEGLEGGLV